MSDTQREIDSLRRQVETLMQDRVTPAVSRVAGRAQDTVTEVSERVRAKPIGAILIAIAIGYLLGRAT